MAELAMQRLVAPPDAGSSPVSRLNIMNWGRRILLINQQGRRPLFVSKSCFFFDFSGF